MGEEILSGSSREKLLWRKAARLLKLGGTIPDDWPEYLSVEHIAILQYGDGEEAKLDREALFDEIKSAINLGRLIPYTYETCSALRVWERLYPSTTFEKTKTDYEKSPMHGVFPTLAAESFRGWFAGVDESSGFIKAWLGESKPAPVKPGLQTSTVLNISKAPPPITPLRGIGIPPRKEPPKPANYETWKKADLWTIDRSILLLLKLEALPKHDANSGRYGTTTEEQALANEYWEIAAIAGGSIRAGMLQTVRPIRGYISDVDCLRLEIFPSIFLAWARLKGYSIPSELADTGALPQSEPDPKASGKPATGTRDSQWHELVWRAFLETGKPPAKVVAKAIQENYQKFDTEGIIQEIDGDTVSLRSRYGNEYTYNFSSLPSLLSRLKNDPPF